MAIRMWIDNLSVGISTINTRHEAMIDFVSQPHDACLDGKIEMELAELHTNRPSASA